MASRKTFTFISLSCGSGGTVVGLSQAGGRPKFVCDPRARETKNIHANHPALSYRQVDARWFYNRKENGLNDIIGEAGVSVGELDVLEASVRHSVIDKQSKSLPNFYDFFGLAKRIRSKLLVAFGPAELSSDKNLPALEAQLSVLRFVNSKDEKPERSYFTAYRVLNASDFGAAVSNRYTVVIGIRADIARRNKLADDLSILNLFPVPANYKALSLGDVLNSTSSDPAEEIFWSKQISSNPPLLKTARLLPTEPENIVWLPSLGEHQLRKIGYKKNEGAFVYRLSELKPIPDLTGFDPADKANTGLLHPLENRSLTITEIKTAFGFPEDYHFGGTEFEKATSIIDSIPPYLAKAIGQSLSKFLQSPKSFSVPRGRIAADNKKQPLAETLRAKSSDLRTYHCDVDLGDAYGRDLWGKTPIESHYDYFFDADEIGEDFVVLGPPDKATGERPVIGGIKRAIFSAEDKRRFVSAITKIKSTTEYRGSCSPEPIRPEIIKKLKASGAKYEISPDGRSYRKWILGSKNKPAKWDRWRTNPIPSVTEGWSREKTTRKPQLSKAYSSDPKMKEDFDYLNQKAESAYIKIAPVEFRKQRKIINARMGQQYRLGKTVFTSMAINKYGDEMPAMNYHIDSGDENSGLTSISVFKKGNYKGGYFIMPQYRCAFRVGDGDVFVGNSRKTHGVSQIEGTGKRYSVVSYAATLLGYKEFVDRAYPPKSPRPEFRITSYRIAIPSYKRAETLKKKTLALLTRHNIDPKRVTIFVANESERKTYEKALKDSPYNNLVVGELGIMEIRNFMWNYFPEGTPVLFIDDDIKDMKMLVPADGAEGNEEEILELISVPDLEEDLIRPGFHIMREHNSYIWGINAANNDFYMKNQVSVGLYYIIASFYGAIIRHDKNLLCGTDDKEDYERSVQHYIKDGRVVRLSFATADTAYYKEPGGMNATRTGKTVSKGAEYMLRKYPKYCEDAGIRDKGQNKGMREIRLKEDMG